MKRNTLIVLMIACALIAGVANGNISSSKSKKTFYYCQLYSNVLGNNSTEGMVTGIEQKGKKITIEGTFFEAESLDAYTSGKYTEISNKSFKMTKKCKYVYTTGKKSKKVSKSRFFKLIRGEWGPAFTLVFYTDSTGKITEMNYDVSM